VLAGRQPGVAGEWAAAVASVQHVTVGRTQEEHRRGVECAVQRAPSYVSVWETAVVVGPVCRVGMPTRSGKAEGRRNPVCVAGGFEGCARAVIGAGMGLCGEGVTEHGRRLVASTPHVR
jgi:hypothetical protein